MRTWAAMGIRKERVERMMKDPTRSVKAVLEPREMAPRAMLKTTGRVLSAYEGRKREKGERTAEECGGYGATPFRGDL